MKVFVGCSSHDEIPSKYLEDCKKLLEVIMKDNDLVFGAYDQGIMNIAYQETLKNNNNVLSIVPKRYQDDLKRLKGDSIITEDISNRALKLINESDILLYLPGGIGTIHELFTALELKRSHEFDKPIIIYNCCGFYDEIIKLLNKMYQENFIPVHIKDTYFILNTKDEVINLFNSLS